MSLHLRALIAQLAQQQYCAHRQGDTDPSVRFKHSCEMLASSSNSGGQSSINKSPSFISTQRFGPWLMIAPLDENVTGHTQQVGLWIAHFAQVSCPQQSQIGLLCQIFDIHGRAHAPTQEPQKAPIPALLPPREHRPIRHAVSLSVRSVDSLVL